MGTTRRSRVVRPETITLDLSNDDWILIKKRLNQGELQDAFAHQYVAGFDGQLRVNPLTTSMTQVTAYLLDWSLIGLDDQPIVIRDKPINVVEAALKAIEPESFAEIREAIEAHELRMAQERAAQKKILPGAPIETPPSASPSAAAGASSGSVN